MLPDFYRGKAMKPLDFSKLPAFLAEFPTDKVCRPAVCSVFALLSITWGTLAEV